jgi:hypothetical protein
MLTQPIIRHEARAIERSGYLASPLPRHWRSRNSVADARVKFGNFTRAFESEQQCAPSIVLGARSVVDEPFFLLAISKIEAQR